MNLYFLLEGKRTERKVYGGWLPQLLPEFTQVKYFDDAADRNFFLFSSEGYPSLLGRHLDNAIQDIVRVGNYTHLVICLDADECTPAARAKEVVSAVEQHSGSMHSVQLQVIVQNRCLETWFLGNRRIVSRAPSSLKLRDYLAFYDIIENDPEQMGVHPDFAYHSPFHYDYLRAVFREKSLTYAKAKPGHACDGSFLDALEQRVADTPDHLKSFSTLLTFCSSIRQSVREF